MHRQSFSMVQEEDPEPPSTGPTETDFYANNPNDAQLFPVGFSMDPTVYQQQYNLPASFASYTQPFSNDMTQTWATPQQPYVDHSSQSPIQQGFPPLVPRLSIAKSLVSDEGDDTSEPTSPRDEASERRKERRRAQNRAAQRAFRARKEDTIKESSARLEALQDELIRLQSSNGNLSDTIGRLRSEIAQLRHENAALRGRRVNEGAGWNYAKDEEEDLTEMVGSARASLDEQEGRAIGFGVQGGMIGTVQWQDTGRSKAERDDDKSVAETVIDAAAALTKGIF